MTRLLGILITAIIFSSCCSYNKRDLYFTASDLKPISSFKQGDTIYFENASGDIDTILIHKIDSISNPDCGGFMAKPAENYLSVAIKYLPNDKLWTGTTTNGNNGKTEIEYQSIITIDKRPQTKEMDYTVSFKDFYSTAIEITNQKVNQDTIVINGKSITNYYSLNHHYPERVLESSNIELVYWTDRDGIIAYKNKGGVWWTKKSSP